MNKQSRAGTQSAQACQGQGSSAAAEPGGAEQQAVGSLLDERGAIDRVMRLMAVPGASGEEGQIAEAIVDELTRAGLPAERLEFDQANRRTRLKGQTGNLIVRLPGTRRGPRRLLSAHLDTVPICVGSRPQRQGDVIRSRAPDTGLGGDNRAGCAVILTALLEILKHELAHPPLTWCWFVQEEVGLQGSRHVGKRQLGRPKLGFNWDGGVPSKLTVGATGGYRLRILVRGIASHAGIAPEKGVSAISIAALAIADLQRRGWHGRVCKGRRTGTCNVGLFQGGTATNVVTDRVELRAEARSHDPEFRQRIVAEIKGAFERAVPAVANDQGATGCVEFDGQLDYESFRLDATEPCVLAAREAVRRAGCEPLETVANGGVDANWTTRHGIPTVTLGCGQRNQHMVSETLQVSEFLVACRIALDLATDLKEY